MILVSQLCVQLTDRKRITGLRLLIKEIEFFKKKDAHRVKGHVREQLPAPLLRVPRLVRFSCFGFPANNDVSE